MHIVFVTTELATDKNSSGGLASFTANIARVFAANDNRVTIILVTTKDEKIEFDSNIELKRIYVEKGKWVRLDYIAKVISKVYKESRVEIRRALVNLCKGKKVKKLLNAINNQEKVDLVHFCNHGFFSLRSNQSIPYVVRISGYLNILSGGANTANGSVEFEDNPPSIKDKLEFWALKKARYTISPSELLAEIGRNCIGINPIVIESPFVLLEENWDIHVYEERLKDKKYILFFGTLNYLKGVQVLAGIAEKFLDVHKDMYFVLSGKDTEVIGKNGEHMLASEYIKECAGRFSDRVIYIGRLVRESLYPIIQNAEICLLPSRIENLSNACIEAMAMGKIVVATKGASYEQLIDDKVSGFLCERDNPASFLQAIEDALALNEEAKRVMILKAKERIELLSPENIYKKYLECYQMIIREW